MTLQQIQQILSIEECEHFIGRPVSEAFSPIRIDVIHHQADLILRVRRKVSPFRNKHADELVVAFCRTLLERRAGVTIKDTGSSFPLVVILNGCRVRKLCPVIGKAHPKDLREIIVSEQIIKMLKYSDHRS